MKRDEKVAAIENALNVITLDCEELAKNMQIYMHRTNQQTFTRLCQEWLKVCADDKYPCDLRNQASHDFAKEVFKNREELRDFPIPFC